MDLSIVKMGFGVYQGHEAEPVSLVWFTRTPNIFLWKDLLQAVPLIFATGKRFPHNVEPIQGLVYLFK